MKRYRFLTKESVYSALNKLRNAFLAAKDGNEVEEIIKGILTQDERLKIGRRIQIAQLIKMEITYDQIARELKVGKQTVLAVEKKLSNYPLAFELVNRRERKVEGVFKKEAYIKSGGSKLLRKRVEYTGFTRKDVKR